MINLIAQSIVAVALLFLLVIIDPILALMVGLTLGLGYAFFYKISSNFLNRIGKERVKENQLRFMTVNEVFGAVKEIKLGGFEYNFIKRFDLPAKAYAKHESSSQIISQLPRYIFEIISFGGMFLVILYLMLQNSSFYKALPVISIYAFAGYRLMPALQQIYIAATRLRFTEPALENLHKDLMGLKFSVVNDDKSKINFKFVDLGGGIGIPYSKKDKKLNLNMYSKLVKKFIGNRNIKIIFEPGRFIVGNTSILITKIIYIKKSNNKNFIILDAGMNDFMRPALYDAHHNIVALKNSNRKISGSIEFVGPICESTDKFLNKKSFSSVKEGDFVAITDVGAYGMTLASNYNTRPTIAEIMVSGSKHKLIRKRQSLEHLINN